MKIKGTIRYITLEISFWGIETDSGEKFIPVNMPEQLKSDGRKVIVEADTVSHISGLHMWGEYVKVTSFET